MKHEKLKIKKSPHKLN